MGNGRFQRTKARPKSRDPDARPPAKLTRSADYSRSQGCGTRRGLGASHQSGLCDVIAKRVPPKLSTYPAHHNSLPPSLPICVVSDEHPLNGPRPTRHTHLAGELKQRNEPSQVTCVARATTTRENVRLIRVNATRCLD